MTDEVYLHYLELSSKIKTHLLMILQRSLVLCQLLQQVLPLLVANIPVYSLCRKWLVRKSPLSDIGTWQTMKDKRGGAYLHLISHYGPEAVQLLRFDMGP